MKFNSAIIGLWATIQFLSCTATRLQSEGDPLVYAVQSDDQLKEYLIRVKNGSDTICENNYEKLFDYIQTLYQQPVNINTSSGLSYFSFMCNAQNLDDKVFERAVVLATNTALINPSLVNVKEDLITRIGNFCTGIPTFYGAEACKTFHSALFVANMIKHQVESVPALKDVAVILGDHWIKDVSSNGYKLEGSSSKPIVDFVLRTMRKHASHLDNVPQLIDRFEVLQRFYAFYSLGKTIISQKLIARAYLMYFELMRPGETAVLHFGWSKPTSAVRFSTSENPNEAEGSSGHAMLLEITKIAENETDLRIYNSGDGIGYHQSIMHGEVRRFSPYVEYNRVEIEQLRRYSFFEGFLSLANPVEVIPLDVTEGADIYAVLMRPFVNQVSEAVPTIYIKDQKAGTCTFSVVTAYLITKMIIEDFRVLRRQFDIEGWEAGYKIVPADGLEEIQHEILQRGLQTTARRLLRHSKRGDSLGDQVKVLQSMHDRLKEFKLNLKHESFFPELKAEQLVDGDEAIREFLRVQQLNLISTGPATPYQGGFEIPRFKNDLIAFFDECVAFLNSRDPLLSNDSDFVGTSLIETIIKEVPSPDSEYWKSLHQVTAKNTLVKINVFLFRFCSILALSERVTYSGLLVLTKLYLAAWVCAERADSAIFEGFRPSLAYIENAFNQPSMFALKPRDSELMGNLVEWAYNLDGDPIFDYRGWKTNSRFLVFDTEDKTARNHELRLIKNLQNIVTKSQPQQFENFKANVMQSFYASVQDAQTETIDDGVILGYLWAIGSESTFSFNIMRDIAILVMTSINKISCIRDYYPGAINYFKNDNYSYDVSLRLSDDNVNGTETSISSQEMFFKARQIRNNGMQNFIINSMSAGAFSLECVTNSKMMRIPNLIAYYTDEPDTLLLPSGFELLIQSVMNPAYNKVYMNSSENCQILVEFLDRLQSFFDTKIKAEGLLNSENCPMEFYALTALMWLKAKVSIMMQMKGYLVKDFGGRKAIRLQIADFLTKSRKFGNSFLTGKFIRNILHTITALTYTKEDLEDLSVYKEFLGHAIKVAQTKSKGFPIIFDDFWGMLTDMETLIKKHEDSIDIKFAQEIFPEFKCEKALYNFPVLQLQSSKDLSGNQTVIRINMISGFFTMDDNPASIQLHRIFGRMNLKLENFNFESSISGNGLMLVDQRGHKSMVVNGIVYYVIEDGSLCQAVDSSLITMVNNFGLYAEKHPNQRKYDLWVCPTKSSTGALLTDGDMNITMEISSEGKITLRDSTIQKATVIKQLEIFGNFEINSAVTSFCVEQLNSFIFSFNRYKTEDGKRLILTAAKDDLSKIHHGQEYLVASDQSIPYGRRFGKYLVIEKISVKAGKSRPLKIVIPFFNGAQRYQEPELGVTSHTCYLMDLNEDRTIKPASRIHTLVLAHQLLWAGYYHETFDLLQTADQNNKLTDEETTALASIIMYSSFSNDRRPEASALSVHALVYFYKMHSLFEDPENKETSHAFTKIIMSKEKREYRYIKDMVRDKLSSYYRNENNVPAEMRIMNQKQAVTSLGWLDLQMMKSRYLKTRTVKDKELSQRFTLKRLPKHHTQSFSEIHRLYSAPNFSAPFSLFRPSESNFCNLGHTMINTSMVNYDDMLGQSAFGRLSYSREEKSVQGMRRILTDIPRQNLAYEIGNTIPLAKKDLPAFDKPPKGKQNPFDTDHFTPQLADHPERKILLKIDEEETVLGLAEVYLEKIEEPEKVSLEQSCEEDGYCLHRYGWFNEEIEKGRHAYMEKSKNAEMYIRKLSDTLQAKEVIQNLTETLMKTIAQESETTRNTWATVKKLSVEILQSSPGSEAYFMKIGRMSVKPTKRSLTDAFIRESMDDYLEIYPGATEEQIREIHGQIGTFYASQTRSQHFQRALKLVEKIQKSSGAGVHSHKHEKRLALIRALKEELIDKAERAYRIGEFPVFAVFESFANVRLRKDQVEVLQTLLTKTSGHDFDSRIVQMMMSGGKTFVLGTLLAFCKADGYHLSTIIVPQSLFETNYLDMKDRSWRFFHQPCFPFTFDRTKRSNSEDNIKVLLHKLYDVIKNRGYIITTPQSMLNLANTFTENLDLFAPDFDRRNSKSLMMIKELFHVFLTRGAATFDEIDLNFVPSKELNFPTSAKKGLDEAVLGTMKRIFHWIATDKELTSKIDVLHNRQALTEPSEHPAILSRIVDMLYEDLIGDKNQRQGYLLPEKFDKKSFVEFMTVKVHDTPPALIESAYLGSEGKQQSVGLQRLLEIHHILHSDLLLALTRTVNLHFGPSNKHPELLIAKPFVAANTPSETSDFAGKWETVCKTFIMYLNNGICMDYENSKLEMFMKFLQSQAKQEIREMIDGDLTKTKPAVYFFQATGEDLFLTALSNTTALKRLHKKATDKSIESIEMVLEFVLFTVLSPLRVHLDQIYAFPLNVPSMFRSTQGYSGTIDEIFNFPHEIIFPGKAAMEAGQLVSDKVRFDSGSSGWIITNLIQENNKMMISDLSDDAISIPDIITMAKSYGNNHRVLIDLGALFKGTSNVQVAKGLAQYFNEQENNEIGAVLFFDNFTDRLMYIKVGEDEPKEIAGTSSALIRSTTKLPHSKIFTYLDNNHFTGVDILQTFDSRAIITTNSEFTARDMVQAIMRMRGFLKMQRVDFLVTKDLKLYMESKKFELSLAGLVTMSVRNSIDLEQKYYERAGFQKLINFYRQFILRQIIMKPNSDIYGQLFIKLSDLFKRSSEKNYFNLTFGAFRLEQITFIMEEYSANIIRMFKQYVTEEEIAFLKKNTDEIIAQGKQFISGKLPYKKNSAHSLDSEATVEVSSQVETEQQMEQNTTSVNSEDLHIDIKWGKVLDEYLEPGLPLDDRVAVHILNISDAIKSTEGFEDYSALFDSRLCVSSNYLYYEKEKICLFNCNQKQIHTLLVVVDKSKPKEIKSLIALANKEADELGDLLNKAELDSHIAFLVDSFGTIINSQEKPTAEVLDDLKTLLLDAHLLSGNIGNLDQPLFKHKLDSWVTKKTGLKVRFINEVVRKSMKYLKSSDILATKAYRMLKENCDGIDGVISGDIFAQKIHANRINEIYMSVLEHSNYFGIQCNRFDDYLKLLSDLSGTLDYPDMPTYRKICDIIIPRLAEQCAIDDQRVESLIASISYVDDDGKVIESLKELAMRKPESQKMFITLVKDLMLPENFRSVSCYQLQIYYSQLVLDDSETCEEFSILAENMDPDTLLRYGRDMFSLLESRRKPLTDCFKPILRRILRIFLDTEPGRIIGGLMEEKDSILASFLIEQRGALKEKLEKQQTDLTLLASIYQHYATTGNQDKIHEIFSAKEREEIFNRIYFSDVTISPYNERYVFENIKYVYHDTETGWFKIVLKLADANIDVFKTALNEYFCTQRFVKADHREFFDRLVDLMSERPEVMAAARDTVAFAKITSYLEKEYPVYSKTLQKMLLMPNFFSSFPVLEYAAKTFVMDKSFLQFLDNFLRDRPCELHHYVRNCIRVGSLEYLKLNSFKDRHYQGNSFNIDYFLRDYVPLVPQIENDAQYTPVANPTIEESTEVQEPIMKPAAESTEGEVLIESPSDIGSA